MAKQDGPHSQSVQFYLWLLLFLAKGRISCAHIEPRSPLVRIGETLVLRCVSPCPGTASPLPVWRRPGDRPFVPVADHSLRITAQGQADSGSYECEVTCSVGKRLSSAYLIVYDIPEEPKVEQHPTVAMPGRAIQLTCTVPVVIPSSLSVEFIWYKSDDSGSSVRAVGRSGTNVTLDWERGGQAAVGWLHVDAPSAKPGGLYTCAIAINKQEIRVRASLRIQVAATETPTVGTTHATPRDSTTPPLVTTEAKLSSVEYPTKERATLPEAATGAPTRSSSLWTATGHRVSPEASLGWGSRAMERSPGAEMVAVDNKRRALSAVATQDEDAGVYHCVAMAPTAASSSYFSITVVKGMQRETCHEALATVGGTITGAGLGLAAGAYMVKKFLSKSYTLCQ